MPQRGSQVSRAEGEAAITGYIGRLLHDDAFSPRLKQSITESISLFHSLERIGSFAIPYISAWHGEEKNEIWYEYAGSRLTDLLDCIPGDEARSFREKIVDHCVYKRLQEYDGDVVKEVTSSEELGKMRSSLRDDVRSTGAIEAIYKLGIDDKEVWLKDQARIEYYGQDNIFVSAGLLFDVSKEMKVEEELKVVREALARHRDHLEELVGERTQKLQKAQLDVVLKLARAAECRDQKTGDHITRMSHYCVVIGKAVGLSQKANNILFYASSMHDVGKLGIADTILHKPGRLSSQEYEAMKEHCELGADLLDSRSSDLLKVAQNIALTHHERWDGQGYPNGLSKDEIPLAGRIVALCDVFDALMSERPYKRAWSMDEAVAEIKRQRGLQFDPLLVDLFIENLPALTKIFESQQ